MFVRLFRLPATAAIAVTVSFLAASGPGEAKDWLSSVERHYKAAEATKYVPRGNNPQWDFDLNTVVNDMAWRARTAAMLRGLPRPGAEREETPSSQLADGQEPPRPRFRF